MAVWAPSRWPHRPVRHPVLTGFCKSLTTIAQEQVDAAAAFPEAMVSFTAWLGQFDRPVFCSWGDYDRKQLDERALMRFARFGYGHHTAAALTMLLRVGPEVFVKWLAMQDYVAITVALRALGIQPELFEAMIASMPWRDLPSPADLQNVRRRFEALSKDEAVGIFELWRTHAFRRRLPNEDVVGAA